MPRAKRSACCGAAQTAIDEGLAKPILIGRRSVMQKRIERLGLRLQEGRDFELVDPENDQRYKEYWTLYHSLTERRGVSPDVARDIVRTRPTLIAALMVRRGEADALHLRHRRPLRAASGAMSTT